MNSLSAYPRPPNVVLGYSLSRVKLIAIPCLGFQSAEIPGQYYVYLPFGSLNRMIWAMTGVDIN